MGFVFESDEKKSSSVNRVLNEFIPAEYKAKVKRKKEMESQNGEAQ
jgi:hypothetical protein